MACCNCCCPDGAECCKAPGPDGICCAPERCCGTSEAPVCCSELDPIQFCCGEVCCNEGQYCCDGVCQEEPCGTPCSLDADCSYNQASCSDLGGCEVDGTTVRLFPDTAQGLLDALDYINALDPGSCGACTVDPATGKCCDDLCYPDVGDLPGFYTLPLACP